MSRATNWIAICAGLPALFIARELDMRNRILAIAAISGALATVGAIAPPVAAQAQSTVGRAGTVVIEDSEGIAVEQRPAFREYIVRERVPTFTVPDRVIVGGVLPDAGITYYDVPQTYGSTPYRYTVVNGQTVLVEPRSRRIVQVVE
jgi:RNase P/RNase MRP subunit p29